MKFDLYSSGLYFITDSKLTKKNIFDDAENALKAGVRIIQYREKEKSTKGMYEDALKLRKITKKNNAFLIINDRIDIALAVDADGVHLGQGDMPYNKARELLGKNKIVGLTVHDINEARIAERKGADYIALSPIFDTETKKDAGKAAGLEFIFEVKKNIKIPFTCIGGINLNNVSDVISAGAKSVCAISATVAQDDVFLECKKFIGKLD